MANIIEFVGEEALNTIANFVNKKLAFASSMPESPDTNTIVLYVGADTSAYKQGGIYLYNGTEWILINNNVKQLSLTKEEYDLLPSSVQNNGTEYFITNGVTTFENNIIQGYYNSTNGKFYRDSSFTTEITGNSQIIYIDLLTDKTYRYDSINIEYILIGGNSYESKPAEESGTDLSLVTTGEKYDWDNKTDKVTNATSGNVAILDANGNLVDSNKTLGKSVPSNAVFTDTKNTAGSTDSSSKLFLVGATSQAANPQTYSQDTAYVGTDGNLYSGSKVVATQNMIGDAWVTSHAYAVGDYCIDGNVLYKCKTAHTSSASYRPPYASYWDAVSVASELNGTTVLYEKKLQFKSTAPNTYTENVNIDISQYSKIVLYDVRRVGSITGTIECFGEIEVPVNLINNNVTVFIRLANAETYTTVTINSSRKITNIVLNGGVSSSTNYWTDFIIYGFK